MSANNSVASSDRPFAGLSVDEVKSLVTTLFLDDSGKAIIYRLGMLDQFMQNRMVTTAHCGARVACAIVVSAILLLMARTYRSFIFGLYQLNLVLMLIASVIELCWLWTFNASLSKFMTNADVPSNELNVSVAATAFTTFLIMSLLATLVVQVWVSFSDLNRRWQVGITMLAALSAFPAYLIWMWRFVLVAINDLGAAAGVGSSAYGFSKYLWVYNGAWRSFAASTSFCALILCVKLWLVHRNRINLGIEVYDPVRILMAMAFQNSVIPAILAIISSAMSTENFAGQSISACTIPLTAVLLPVGYIWAQYNVMKSSQVSQTLRIETETKTPRSDYSQPWTASTDESGASDYKI